MKAYMVGWNWNEDEAPESDDSDGDFVPPSDEENDWDEIEDENQ